MTTGNASAVEETHRRIIAVVEPVLSRRGFALAGGNALRAHGLSARPTRDINMFTARAGAITQAAPQVETALRAAGFAVQPAAAHTDLAGLVPDWADYDTRWIVTAGGQRVLLQLGFDERVGQPVLITGIGPVLGVEDVLGGKVLALVDRADARDFIDVAEAMRRGWSPEQLIALAWRLSPDDYDAEQFTQVPARLAGLDDFEFAQYGLDHRQVKELRELFTGWPAPQQ